MSNYGCGCGNVCVGCGCPKTTVGQGMARMSSARESYLQRHGLGAIALPQTPRAQPSVGQGPARTPSARDAYLSRGITSHVPHTSWSPNPYVWHTPSPTREFVPRPIVPR